MDSMQKGKQKSIRTQEIESGGFLLFLGKIKPSQAKNF